MLEDVLLDPVAISRGHFRPEAIRQLVDEHVSNRWDHSYRLWCLLCLEVWHRIYLDATVPPASPPASL